MHFSRAPYEAGPAGPYVNAPTYRRLPPGVRAVVEREPRVCADTAYFVIVRNNGSVRSRDAPMIFIEDPVDPVACQLAGFRPEPGRPGVVGWRDDDALA